MAFRDAPDRKERNYEMRTMTLDHESAYDTEGSRIPPTSSSTAGLDPYGMTEADRKRSRLSYYLNRRSAGAAAYWQRRQQREADEAAEQEEAFQRQLAAEPTPQMYKSAAQQALIAAMDVNKETLQAITNMERVANETEAIGQESAVAVRRDEEIIDNVDGQLRDMEPTLKRAKRDLIQFFRLMMRDKMIVCLVFVAVGLAVTVIIVSKVKGSPSVPFSFSVSNGTSVTQI